MFEKVSRNFSVNGYRIYSLGLVSLLIAALLVSWNATMPQAGQPLRAQTHLLELATRQPDSRVSIIVQKQTSDSQAEGIVTRLGGEITTDLHIINGFTATLSAQFVPELARSASVRWVSLDAPVASTYIAAPDDTKLKSAFIKTIGVDKVWKWNDVLGKGIGIGVIDSGLDATDDDYDDTSGYRNRIVASNNTSTSNSTSDRYGHGSHVAGIAAGNGRQSKGEYVGVAPGANLINIKVSNDAGGSTISNVVAGMQWAYDNRNQFNIRVVNISLSSSIYESYLTNPLCAAAEILWFNGIVVVVSAGNGGNQNLLPPANDPFVITVGATDDKGTTNRNDDTLAPFSAYGLTLDGVAKPDLVAPGTNIVSILADPRRGLAVQHPKNIVEYNYFRMSGTSMAAPMVAGTVALILQANPNLTPNQVKYRLKSTARPFDLPLRAGAGYLDTEAAVKGTSTRNANTYLKPSRLLNLSGNSGSTGNTASWSTASWSTASWSTASWSTASWSSTYWAPGE